MPGRILITRDGVPVAEVEWTGTRASGTAAIRKVNEDDAETIKNLRRAIADRRDLARVRFTTARGSVPGWRGFDGYLAGLLVVLPALGLDAGPVAWPDQNETV